MKISIALALLILALGVPLGWLDHQRLARTREHHTQLVAAAAQSGTNRDPKRRSDGLRGTKRGHENKEEVARKLAAGEEIHLADPASYCYGVAHNILKEYWREPARETLSLDSQPNNDNPPPNATVPPSTESERQETEINLAYLDTCLQRLSLEDRELILKYYQGDHRGRINNRHELAAELGLSPGSLRIRALRIREQLHDWMRRATSGGNVK